MNAARLWPIGVVLALLAGVGSCVVLMWAANQPGTAVTEPDYYEQAVAWDSTLAARRASDALGWRAGVTLGAAGAGGAPLEIALADRDGRPVTGAVVRIAALHNSDPARWVRATLPERTPGRYGATVAFRRAGRWEVRIEARRGTERFLDRVRREAARAPL